MKEDRRGAVTQSFGLGRKRVIAERKRPALEDAGADRRRAGTGDVRRGRPVHLRAAAVAVDTIDLPSRTAPHRRVALDRSGQRTILEKMDVKSGTEDGEMSNAGVVELRRVLGEPAAPDDVQEPRIGAVDEE